MQCQRGNRIDRKDGLKWVNDGADLNAWKTPVFARDVAALKQGESIVHPVAGNTIESSELIVIEEPIGRGSHEMSELIDFMVLIDTPFEIALARRLLRSLNYLNHHVLSAIEEKTKEELVEGIIRSVRHELNDYLDVSRDLYIAVQQQVETDCDLILDGRLAIDELAKQRVAAVEEKRK